MDDVAPDPSNAQTAAQSAGVGNNSCGTHSARRQAVDNVEELARFFFTTGTQLTVGGNGG